MTISRCHCYRPITDGDKVIPNISVRVLEPGSTTAIPETMYAGSSGSSARTSPQVYTNGVVDFYLASAKRVRLGVTPPSSAEFFIEDVDVLPDADNSVVSTAPLKVTNTASAAGESLISTATAGEAEFAFIASGGPSSFDIDPVVIGHSATAAAAGEVAVGVNAQATATEGTAVGATAAAAYRATAVGRSSNASGDLSVAVGIDSLANSVDAVAVGHAAHGTAATTTSVGPNTVAGGIKASALGGGAQAPYDHSTAIGADAVTTAVDQIMLGTNVDLLRVPGVRLFSRSQRETSGANILNLNGTSGGRDDYTDYVDLATAYGSPNEVGTDVTYVTGIAQPYHLINVDGIYAIQASVYYTRAKLVANDFLRLHCFNNSYGLTDFDVSCVVNSADLVPVRDVLLTGAATGFCAAGTRISLEIDANTPAGSINPEVNFAYCVVQRVL